MLALLLSYKNNILSSFWQRWHTETCDVGFICVSYHKYVISFPSTQLHTFYMSIFSCTGTGTSFLHGSPQKYTWIYIQVNTSDKLLEMFQPRTERPLNEWCEKAFCNIRWLTQPWKISPVNNVMLLSHMPFPQTIQSSPIFTFMSKFCPFPSSILCFSARWLVLPKVINVYKMHLLVCAKPF